MRIKPIMVFIPQHLYTGISILPCEKNTTNGEIMGTIIITNKLVKPFGNTGHITIPKKHIGKKAKVIIIDDEGDEKEKNIISFLRERKRAEILKVFYISGCSIYSEFMELIDKLVENGKIKKDGDYLEVVK
jgi:hypothetical protein